MPSRSDPTALADTEECRRWVAKVVAGLPPLGSEQIATLGRLAAILDKRIETEHAIAS